MPAPEPASLRVVTEDEVIPPTPTKGVIEAAKNGTHRELLVAMRDRIAKAVEAPNCPPRDLAALTRRLHDLAKEIEVIDLTNEPKGGAGSGRDDVDNDEAFDASAI